MAFQELSEHLEESAKKSQDYVKNTAEYYKLRVFKSTMKMTTSLAHGMLIGSLLVLFLAFFSIGMAFVIGELIGGVLWGFFAVAGFYFFLFLIILFFGKDVIVKTMLSKFSDMMFDDEDLEPQHFEKDTIAHKTILPKDYD